MHSITYANENTLMNKSVGGWGGNVGANTRGDFDKKGWAQTGNLVITPTDQLYGPARPCNCHGFPLGGLSLEQAANVSRCSHGQPPVMVKEYYPKPVGSDMPYCRALPSDPVYRIKLGQGCEDITFPSAESARQGCSAYSKNYTFGLKHNCKYDGKVRRRRDGDQYYCVDGPYCKDHTN